MAVYDTPVAPRAAGTFGISASRPLSLLVGAVTGWNDARLTRKALSRLSEHELDDIGLTRSDVERL
jgi:uncharacterized protein YjiS (DUF1127 family)